MQISSENTDRVYLRFLCSHVWGNLFTCSSRSLVKRFQNSLHPVTAFPKLKSLSKSLCPDPCPNTQTAQKGLPLDIVWVF